MEKLDARSHYWIIQKLVSKLETDREFRIEGPWMSVQTYLIQADGKLERLKPAGFGHAYSA